MISHCLSHDSSYWRATKIIIVTIKCWKKQANDQFAVDLTEIKSSRVKETCERDQRRNNKLCKWVFVCVSTDKIHAKFDRAVGNYVTLLSVIRNDHKLFAGHNKLTKITNVYEIKIIFVACAQFMLLRVFFSSRVTKREMNDECSLQ